MSKLQIIDAKKMENLLLVLGFDKISQKGNHVFYRHLDGAATTVPHHAGGVLSVPLIKEILREIEIRVDDYNKYLEKL